MYRDSNFYKYSASQLQEYKTHIEKTLEYLESCDSDVILTTTFFINDTKNELRNILMDIDLQITKQISEPSILSTVYTNNFPFRQVIPSKNPDNTQSQIDEIKEDLKKVKKNQIKQNRKTKKDKTKRGEHTLKTVAEATEDIMNTLSNDVFPYTDDLKHLHKTNKSKAKDITDT